MFTDGRPKALYLGYDCRTIPGFKIVVHAYLSVFGATSVRNLTRLNEANARNWSICHMLFRARKS
jgi:hypothetical protein